MNATQPIPGENTKTTIQFDELNKLAEAIARGSLASIPTRQLRDSCFPGMEIEKAMHHFQQWARLHTIAWRFEWSENESQRLEQHVVFL